MLRCSGVRTATCRRRAWNFAKCYRVLPRGRGERHVRVRAAAVTAGAGAPACFTAFQTNAETPVNRREMNSR